MKRITSVILCLIMIMSMFPSHFVVYANELYVENNKIEGLEDTENKEDKEIIEEQLSNVIVIVEKSYNQGDTFEIFEVITIEDLPVGTTYSHTPLEFENYNLITTEDLSIVVDEDTSNNVLRIRYVQIEPVQTFPDSVINIFDTIEELLKTEDEEDVEDILEEVVQKDIEDIIEVIEEDVITLPEIIEDDDFDLQEEIEEGNYLSSVEVIIKKSYDNGETFEVFEVITIEDLLIGEVFTYEPQFIPNFKLLSSDISIVVDKDVSNNQIIIKYIEKVEEDINYLDNIIDSSERNLKFVQVRHIDSINKNTIYQESRLVTSTIPTQEATYSLFSKYDYTGFQVFGDNPRSGTAGGVVVDIRDTRVEFNYVGHESRYTIEHITTEGNNIVNTRTITGNYPNLMEVDSLKSEDLVLDRIEVTYFRNGSVIRSTHTITDKHHYANIFGQNSLSNVPSHGNVKFIYEERTANIEIVTLKSYDQGNSYIVHDTQIVDGLFLGSTYTHIPENMPNYILMPDDFSIVVDSDPRNNRIFVKYNHYGNEVVINHGFYNDNGNFELLHTELIDTTSALPFHLKRNIENNEYVYDHFSRFPNGTPDLEVFTGFEYNRLQGGLETHVTTHDDSLGLMGIKFLDDALNFYSNEIQVVYNKKDMTVNTIYGYFANDRFIEIATHTEQVKVSDKVTLNPLKHMDMTYEYMYWSQVAGNLDDIKEDDLFLRNYHTMESNVTIDYNSDLTHNIIVVHDRIFADVDILVKRLWSDSDEFEIYDTLTKENLPVGSVITIEPLEIEGFELLNPQDLTIEVDADPGNNEVELMYVEIVEESNPPTEGGGNGGNEDGITPPGTIDPPTEGSDIGDSDGSGDGNIPPSIVDPPTGGNGGNGGGSSGGNTNPSVVKPPRESIVVPPTVTNPPTESIVIPPSITNPPTDIIVAPPSEIIQEPIESIGVPPITTNPPSENSTITENVISTTTQGGARGNNTGNNVVNVNSQHEIPGNYSIGNDSIETLDNDMQREQVYGFLASFLDRFSFPTDTDVEVNNKDNLTTDIKTRDSNMYLLSRILTWVILLVLLAVPFIAYVLLKSNVKVYAKNEDTQEFELVSKIRAKDTELNLDELADKYNNLAIELSDQFIDKFEGEVLRIKAKDNFVSNSIKSKYKTEAIEISI